MGKVELTSDARVLVGIDISKHRHEVLIAVPGKTRRRRMMITNTTEDFMRLIAILREYGMAVRILGGWVTSIYLQPSAYKTHSMRWTKGAPN